jgi:hypothetical protein
MSSKATTGCWGVSKQAAAPAADKSLHSRRRSFTWFGSSSSKSHAEEVPPLDSEEQATLDNLADALFDLDLEESQPATAPVKPSKGDKPLHRRRWSFGRQVAPQPAAQAEAAAADDLLVTSSDISISSQGSPQHAAVAAAAAAAAAALQRPSPAPSASASAAATPAPQRSSGSYRRLWHSITSVRKGDALPGSGAAAPEVSVESLVKAVQVGCRRPASHTCLQSVHAVWNSLQFPVLDNGHLAVIFAMLPVHVCLRPPPHGPGAPAVPAGATPP